MKKRRPKKRPARVIEEPLSFFSQCTEWMENHTRELYIGAVVVLLVAGSVWWYTNFEKHKEVRAQREYSEIMKSYPSPATRKGKQEWEKTIKKLESFLGEFKGTGTVISALLDLGNAYYYSEDYGKAVSTYRQLLDKIDRNHPYRPLVYLDLAYAYEKLKRYNDAISTLKRAQSEEISDTSLASLVHYHLGRLYEETGKINLAIEEYQRFLENEKSGALGAVVEEKIKNLKSKS